MSLESQLWASADILRGKMDASEYKNYLLGLIFYKYLSDLELRTAWFEANGANAELPGRKEQREALQEWFDDDAPELREVLRTKLGYFIEPERLFSTLREEAANFEFQISDLQNAFTELAKQGEQFTGLFDDVDLNSTKLGSGAQQRNVTISDVIKTLDEIDLFGYKGDVIGDAYEYLIAQFAASAGKKAGEFYTPSAVSEIISQIVAIGQENRSPFLIYDPTVGSASLMLHIREFLTHPETVRYFGQELNTTTYNLARMNLILHGVDKDRMTLRNADTLDQDWPTDVPHQFDAVVMNPPYSAHWSAASKFLTDPRFERFGRLAPKTKADYAFLLHGFYHLKDTGTMGIVLPHGVLFRGAAEGTIRQNLLEMGAIDAVIGLPPNIFYGTSIPTVVVILKKQRIPSVEEPSAVEPSVPAVEPVETKGTDPRDVLFIDASAGFEKKKNQNALRQSDIDKIVETYRNRQDVEKYAHLASFDEIKANDYNLNIPRYVDTFEAEEEIDIIALSEEMLDINKQIATKENEFLGMVDQLAVTDETADIINAIKAMFGGVTNAR